MIFVPVTVLGELHGEFALGSREREQPVSRHQPSAVAQASLAPSASSSRSASS